VVFDLNKMVEFIKNSDLLLISRYAESICSVLGRGLVHVYNHIHRILVYSNMKLKFTAAPKCYYNVA
jgi:hypothetical protein